MYKGTDRIKEYKRILRDFYIYLTEDEWKELDTLSDIALENKIRALIMKKLK